jgi:hypothetical protein
MKKLIIGMALCAASISAMAQTNVSISVGQPGFYGQINLGDFAPAPVVYAPQPVIITPAPAYVAEPVYLRVPPGHRMHWARFCGRYHACGRPVLFVRDEWYTNTYVPRYHEHFGGPRVVYRDHPRVIERVERVEYRERGPGPGWDHGPHGGPHGGPHEGPHEGPHGGPHGGWDHGPGEGHGHGEGHGEGHGHGHGRD